MKKEKKIKKDKFLFSYFSSLFEYNFNFKFEKLIDNIKIKNVIINRVLSIVQKNRSRFFLMSFNSTNIINFNRKFNSFVF